MLPRITVFTPTYNRAFCLGNLYESLVGQTVRDFNWLIVDDGSTDKTKDLVDSWIQENKISISYIFKDNGGMHSAHNIAYENIRTELCMCIDSDDTVPLEALEIITKEWNEVENKDRCAGLIGLDIDKNNLTVIGNKFPLDLGYSKIQDIYFKYKIKGDKKIVLRTDVVNNYPRYPIYPGEKLVPLGTLYLMICHDYHFKCINQPLCAVEYLEGGSSRSIFKQYRESPMGFRYARKIELQYIDRLDIKMKKLMHSISSTLFIGDWNFFKGIPHNKLLFIVFPFGLLLHVYIYCKSRL